MSTTLADIRGVVIDYINRPQNESQDRVDAAINRTIDGLQRKHRFTMSERLVRLTYPANSLHVNVADVLGGKIRNLFDAQLVSGTSNTGKVLRISSYSALTRLLNKQQRLSTVDETLENSLDYLDTLRAGSDYSVFLIQGNIGLYPTPQADVTLVVGANIWLNKLVEDDDTNFFLDYCEEYIVLKTLYTLNTLFKTENRNQINANEVQQAYEDCMAWDSQITSTPGETV